MLRAILFAAAVTTAATAAGAQVIPLEEDTYTRTYVYEDDDLDDAYEDDDLDDADFAAPPARYSPPVYGWVYSRPVDCGTFRYWNGERCADARFDPPND